MRRIVYSNTFDRQLADYIEQGELTFGIAVANEKKALVYATIRDTLAINPAIKQPDRSLRLVTYPISRTPFYILYDYDDDELRVHFIYLRGKPLDSIDPTAVEW